MDGMYIVNLILRWMHIFAAITAVGGLIFMRLALVPSVTVLTDEQRKSLHTALRSRWAILVHTSILFLLVSGLTNYLLTVRASKAWPVELPSYYHAIFGVKFLLALVIFFLASALAGRSAAMEKIRQNARFWMTVNLILAVTVVCLSGVLRMAHIGPNTVLSAQ